MFMFKIMAPQQLSPRSALAWDILDPVVSTERHILTQLLSTASKTGLAVAYAHNKSVVWRVWSSDSKNFTITCRPRAPNIKALSYPHTKGIKASAGLYSTPPPASREKKQMLVA